MTICRLLAHAGFDPRHAVRFWEGRQDAEQVGECTAQSRKDDSRPMKWSGSSHPMNEVRLARLKEELMRWEETREKERIRIQEQSQLTSSRWTNHLDTFTFLQFTLPIVFPHISFWLSFLLDVIYLINWSSFLLPYFFRPSFFLSVASIYFCSLSIHPLTRYRHTSIITPICRSFHLDCIIRRYFPV